MLCHVRCQDCLCSAFCQTRPLPKQGYSRALDGTQIEKLVLHFIFDKWNQCDKHLSRSIWVGKLQKRSLHTCISTSKIISVKSTWQNHTPCPSVHLHLCTYFNSGMAGQITMIFYVVKVRTLRFGIKYSSIGYMSICGANNRATFGHRKKVIFWVSLENCLYNCFIAPDCCIPCQQ